MQSGHVSIPFIAGQWSLQRLSFALALHLGVSIPFIAGQWSLLADAPETRQRRRKFQSPSLRGSGRFACLGLPFRVKSNVSIPFIAGQWSLRSARSGPRRARRPFQSPSLRGSGRFLDRPPPHGGGASFNPLHCGAVVASRRLVQVLGKCDAFQSPSLRGSGRFRSNCARRPRRGPRFQSPSLRGSGRFKEEK